MARLPSPALVIAFIALFAALSGAAIGLPGKNSVDKNDIRKGAVRGKTIAKNAVTTSKIKANAVRSSDVRNDALTGDDVNEGSLGKVPSATNADSADSADTAANATGIADNVVTGAKVADGSLAAADAATLTGVVNLNFVNIPAGTCSTQTPNLGVNVDGDVILVTVDDTINFANGGLTVHTSDSIADNLIRINVCNVTAAAIDPPAADFAYMIFQR
jgi:hypothetical protein